MKKENKILCSLFIFYLLFFISIFYNYKPEYNQDDNLLIVGPDPIIFGKYLNNSISAYQDYFDASFVDDLPNTKVNTLIIFAHGHSTDDSIQLRLKNGDISISDLKAKRVIFIACSIGVIRNIDLDTEHFSYSQRQEHTPIIYQFKQNISDSVQEEIINVWAWNIYFLDYIKNGYDWQIAEKLARNDLDNQFYSMYGEFPNQTFFEDS